MKAVFKKKLADTEAEEIKRFCSSAEYFAIEQSIGFSEILGMANMTYFYLENEGVIVSFSQITESFRFAQIWFGPVCNDKEMMIESILRIAEHYRKRHFWYLGIQPYHKTGNDADYIEYALNRQLTITYVFTNEYTKSSLEIDLGLTPERIFGNFRKGHKSAVRKAVNGGIVITKLSANSDLEAFTDVYIGMCNHRGIKGHTEKEITGICNYVLENGSGEVLLARDHKSAVLGGAVFTYQGVSVRYLLSAADHNRKDIPVTHLILFRAIQNARDAGFRYFDFWGYNHFADPDDQIFLINRFKKGFGGYFTFLMKRMNISIVPGGFLLFRIYRAIRKYIPFEK